MVHILQLGDLLLVVDVVLIVNIPGELNPCFSTFNPAQSAGHRNVLAGEQNFEPLGQVPHWNRRKLRARQTHVLQIAEYVIPLIANQQADWLVDLVTRVRVSSVVHSDVVLSRHGSCESKTDHSTNKWLPHAM